VGDRTGLELIRTLQQKVVSMGIDVFMECKILRLLPDAEGRISGAVGYMRPTGEMVVFTAKAFVLATGSIGKSWKYTSNSWESVGDGHAMAIWAGADVIDMECVQFHPTGMVWPLSVRGILVTEGVRGDGGVLRNSEGTRFMFDYVADMFRAETAETEEEADAWYEDHHNNRRTPDLLPRDEVARAINSEVKAGRGSPHGGVFLDIASRRTPEYIRRRLPSMYHQFMELAGVDITAGPLEVGPTCHYMMGGVRVDAETQAATVPGLFAAGEVAGGMHGANRLGGNSLSDLVVFGRRAGIGAADFAEGRTGSPSVDAAEVASVIDEAFAPFGREGGTTPTTSSTSCRRPCSRWSASSAPGPSSKRRWSSSRSQGRTAKVQVKGGRAYNPGWNLATDLPSMITTSIAVAQGALNRKESRGGHTREDYPGPDPELGKVNFVQHQTGEHGLPGAHRHQSRAAARDAGRAARHCSRRHTPVDERRGPAGRPDRHHAGVAGGRRGRRVHRLRDARRRGRGRARRHPPHPGRSEAPDLACRWNCKAGKCGSCSAEINGLPRLMCMTRMDTLPEGEPVTVAPMKTFPIIRDLVTDVSFNYEVAKTVPAFKPGPEPEGGYRMAGRRGARPGVPQVHRVLHVPGRLPRHPRPRGEQAQVRRAPLLHPLRRARDAPARHQRPSRAGAIDRGLGMCNITKCCTEVCPEHIKITDNAIIPMKERVVDAHYDPVAWLGRKILKRSKKTAEEASAG
jgi:succinate dehydrogenase / fumarate reductase flavoprotein subunit